jgi:hypothetical protein
MTRTLRHRLEDACAARGLAWWGTSDVSQTTLEGRSRHRLIAPFWICAYDPQTGDIAAFVAGAPGWTAAKRRLLRALEDDQAAPEVEWRREGVVIERIPARVGERIRTHLLIVRFADGSVEEFAYPGSNRSIRPDTPVAVVKLAVDPSPVILWGSDHDPRRESARPLAGVRRVTADES